MLYYTIFILKVGEITFKKHLRSCLKLIGIFVVILGFCSSALALSAKERAINALLFERKFDEAFEIVKKIDSDMFPEFIQYKGYLLGSGVLSSGKDLCGAIKYLEKAYVKWEFIRNDLNFLYGGDWAGIAAMEGNKQALFDMAYRIYSKRKYATFPFDSSSLAIKEAYKYFYNAELLGHLTAKKYANSLIKKYPNINFSKYKDKIQFKNVICPMRKIQNSKLAEHSWQVFVNIESLQ